jgi:hypothetical protein
MRQTIKKIIALTAGATMVGTTIFGAMAADLADYPSPFVKDGKFDGLIVIGEKAATSDVVGAIDIAAAIQADAKTITEVEGTGVSVSGGKVEDVAISTAINGATVFGTAVDYTDVSTFKKDSVTISIGDTEDTYDWHEELTLGALKAETGLTASSKDEKWKEDVFMPIARGDVGYYFVFDDTLGTNNFISNATSADPIELDFLGKTLTIISADADTITAEVGTSAFLNAGDTIEVNGKTVKLIKTGASSAVVDVDGVQEVVSSGSTKTINGLKVKMKEIFNEDGTEYDSANMVVGTDATKSYNDGDAYIGQNKDDPDWVWDLALLNTNDPTIGILYDQTKDDPSDNPPMMGEAVALPDNYAMVKLDSFKVIDYKKYTVDTSTEELLSNDGTVTDSTSAKVVHLKADGSSKDGFLVSTYKTDDVYLYANDTGMFVYYKDSNDGNKVKNSGIAVVDSTPFVVDKFTLKFRDSNVGADISWNATTEVGAIRFDLGASGTTDDLTIYLEESTTNNQITYLGHSDSDTTTANDLLYGTYDFSGWEENTRTVSGVVVYDPKANSPSDQVVFDLSGDDSDFKVNFAVLGPEGVSSGTGASTTQKINAIPVGMAVLDKDTTVGDRNLIVVGGPCANTVAATLLGNPAECGAGFEAGKAKIKLFTSGTKVSLLVAGYEAMETQGACRVLADYEDYTLAGTEAEVTVTSLSDLKVAKVV